nr:MAG TPA: hypothetical protein [Caudoviricetes sp.]
MDKFCSQNILCSVRYFLGIPLLHIQCDRKFYVFTHIHLRFFFIEIWFSCY